MPAYDTQGRSILKGSQEWLDIESRPRTVAQADREWKYNARDLWKDFLRSNSLIHAECSSEAINSTRFSEHFAEAQLSWIEDSGDCKRSVR